MKKVIYIIALASFIFSFSQTDTGRIEKIKNQLTVLSTDNLGLTENVKTEISVNNITLANFLLAIAEVHKLNINVPQELNQISISPKFPNVIVTDLLVFLCKEYNLTIDFTGNILSVKQYIEAKKEIEERIIPISYDPSNNTISIDAKGDKLYDVFRRLMDMSGKNLVFSPAIETKLLTAYIKDTPFDVAMSKLAYSNNLFVEQTKDGFYRFEDDTPSVASNLNNTNRGQTMQRPNRRRNSNFSFKVLDAEKKILEVDFSNTPINDIVNDIGNALSINVFTATPLDEAGVATFKTKSITFDELLYRLFETQATSSISSQNQSSGRPNENRVSKRFTFKKEGDIYYFGTENQLSVRKVEIVHLQHRSVDLLSDPSGSSNSRRNAGRSNNFNRTDTGLNTFNTGGIRGANQNSFNQNTTSNTNFNNSYNSNANNSEEFLETLVPPELTESLNIKTDKELNSFYVVGSAFDIERFKKFIQKLDKPIPVILIEVMIIEVSKSTTIDTGVSWGIGDEPVETQGAIFPNTDITLGAKTVNKIIGGLNGFGSFKAIPNFFATIKAMEANGDLKVRSSPKLATLNGHRASFSNGETSYYTITDQVVVGSDNPVTQTAINYVPIDAELGITIKPLVSGDGQVTLDISVIQSSFGSRIGEDAPPDIKSREFTSLIRMKDQDIAVLGGLEENFKSNSGSGVPFLARIPLIKYLFSRRTREARKSKLTVLIKPTVYY